MKQLFWKEWMELRYVPSVLMAVMAGMLFLGKYFNAITSTEWASTSFGMIALVWPIAGLLAGCGAFSGETGNGTLRFLSSLPVSRARIWYAKFVSGLAVLCFTMLCTGALWAVAAICFSGQQKNILSGMSQISFRVWAELIMPVVLVFWIFTVSLFISTLVAKPLTGALVTAAVCVALQAIYSKVSDSIYKGHEYQTVQLGKQVEIILFGLIAVSILIFAAASYWTSTRMRALTVWRRIGIVSSVLAALTLLVAPTYAWILVTSQTPAGDTFDSQLPIYLTRKTGPFKYGYVFKDSGGAIDCGGGGAVGSFFPDVTTTGDSSTSRYSGAIDTTAVINPAPQNVYQSSREGDQFRYYIFGLKPYARHLVRFHFSENTFDAPERRVFSVYIGGHPVLTNVDIFKAAGGAHKANIQTVSAKASAVGSMMIEFRSQGRLHNAQINGIDVKLLPQLPAPNGIVRIKCGGKAIGPFEEDTDFSGGWEDPNHNSFDPQGRFGVIDTSAVTDPAPQDVYRTAHYGRCMYTIPGLKAGTPYVVRLHFCENDFNAPGKRVFDVEINDKKALRNFDIFAAAGGAHKANIQECLTRSSDGGEITIRFLGAPNRVQMMNKQWLDGALINAIELLPAASGTARIASAIRSKP